MSFLKISKQKSKEVKEKENTGVLRNKTQSVNSKKSINRVSNKIKILFTLLFFLIVIYLFNENEKTKAKITAIQADKIMQKKMKEVEEKMKSMNKNKQKQNEVSNTNQSNKAHLAKSIKDQKKTNVKIERKNKIYIAPDFSAMMKEVYVKKNESKQDEFKGIEYEKIDPDIDKFKMAKENVRNNSFAYIDKNAILNYVPIPPPNEKIDFKEAPLYEKYGRGLVYNCVMLHTACVDKEEYLRCRQNRWWALQNNKKPACTEMDVFFSNTDCEYAQQLIINHGKDIEGCKK